MIPFSQFLGVEDDEYILIKWGNQELISHTIPSSAALLAVARLRHSTHCFMICLQTSSTVFSSCTQVTGNSGKSHKAQIMNSVNNYIFRRKWTEISLDTIFRQYLNGTVGFTVRFLSRTFKYPVEKCVAFMLRSAAQDHICLKTAVFLMGSGGSLNCTPAGP